MSPVTVCGECAIDSHIGTDTGLSMAASVLIAMTEHCGTVKYVTNNTETRVNVSAAGVVGEQSGGVGDFSGYYSGQKTYQVQENLRSVEGKSGNEMGKLGRDIGRSDRDLGNKSKAGGGRGNLGGGGTRRHTTLDRGSGPAGRGACQDRHQVRQPVGPAKEAARHMLLTQPQTPQSFATRAGGSHTSKRPTVTLLSVSERAPPPAMARNRRSSVALPRESPSRLTGHRDAAATSLPNTLSSRPGAEDAEATPYSHSLLLPHGGGAASSSLGGVGSPLSGNLVSGLVSTTPGSVSLGGPGPFAGGQVSTPAGLVESPSTSLGLRPLTGGQESSPAGLVSKPPGGHVSTSFPVIPPPERPVSWAGGRVGPAGGRMTGRVLEMVVLLLTLLLATPAAARYDRGGPQHSITWGRGNSHSSAVFGNVPTNVTAVLGHRARLPCQVKNLGLKDVSWIRQRDLHILTVGIFTYTSDDRFKVFHPPEAEDWFLDISSVTFRDAGVYECQVSTSPKVSLPIHLTVLAVQEADILGPQEVYIQHGSTISLHCEVQAGVEAVGPVRWLRGASTLNYSSPRGGISMEVEKTPTKTMSKLYITRAVRADSGNYTCAPTYARPDSVIVHVVNAGEESAAAVQSGVEAARACVGVVWAATLLAAWLRPAHSSPWRP